jgi:hypothetical protein
MSKYSRPMRFDIICVVNGIEYCDDPSTRMWKLARQAKDVVRDAEGGLQVP